MHTHVPSIPAPYRANFDRWELEQELYDERVRKLDDLRHLVVERLNELIQYVETCDADEYLEDALDNRDSYDGEPEWYAIYKIVEDRYQ